MAKPAKRLTARVDGAAEPVAPTAAVKIVSVELLSLRELELRIVIWPLTADWLLVPPVRSDLRVVEPPLRERPDIEWRAIALDSRTAHRLFVWRWHLPGPAWQYLPARLQLDAVWLRPANAPLEHRATAVHGPWLFEVSHPGSPSACSDPTPRLRPFGGATAARQESAAPR